MARQRLLFAPFLALSCCFALAQSFDDLVLGVPNFKPYTYLEDGVLKGTGVEKVSATLDTLPVKYEITYISNYSKLLKALKKDQIQGFFLATQNPERDKYAILASPIEYNNWAWFTLKSSPLNPEQSAFKLEAKVATIGKTNTYRWLIRHGYRVHSYKNTQLPDLLLSKNIDGVFVAEKVFEDVCKESNIDLNHFKKSIKVARPFSIYLSKRYLSNNKLFLDQLNANIQPPKPQ